MKSNVIFKNTGLITAIAFTALQIFGIGNIITMPAHVVCISLYCIVLRFVYLVRFSDVRNDLARYLLWFGWDLSMVVLPVMLYSSYASMVGMNIIGGTYMYSAADVDFCIAMGGLALTINFLVSFWVKNTKPITFDYFPKLKKSTFVTMVIWGMLTILIALFAAKMLGTGTLGVQGNLLPFKLSGIINFLAYYLFFFYIFFILDGFTKFGHSLLIPISITLFIALNNAYVSMSKSALITPVVMIGIYMILSRRGNLKVLLLLALLLSAGFYLGGYIASYRASLSAIRTLMMEEVTMDYGVLQYAHRTFPEGYTLQKFHALHVEGGDWEDLASYEYNPIYYNTYKIDKADPSTMHSSGCPPLAGAYLFGMPFFILMAACMSLAVTACDYLLPRSQGVFASTLMRAFFTFYMAIIFSLQLLINFLTGLFGVGVYTNALFPIMIFGCYFVYLKFFCVKRPLPPDHLVMRGKTPPPPFLAQRPLEIQPKPAIGRPLPR